MIGGFVALGLFAVGMVTAAVAYRRQAGHWPAWRAWITTEPLPDDLTYDPWNDWMP